MFGWTGIPLIVAAVAIGQLLEHTGALQSLMPVAWIAVGLYAGAFILIGVLAVAIWAGERYDGPQRFFDWCGRSKPKLYVGFWFVCLGVMALGLVGTGLGW